MRSLKNFINESLNNFDVNKLKNELKDYFEDLKFSDYGDVDEDNVVDFFDTCISAIDNITNKSIVYSTDPNYFYFDSNYLIKQADAQIETLIEKAQRNFYEEIEDSCGYYYDEHDNFIWANVTNSYQNGDEFNLVIIYDQDKM